MNWINHSTELHGDTVALLPLEEYHFAELDCIAQVDRIWEFIPVDMSTEIKRLSAFNNALTEKMKGTQFPFVIIDKRENKIIGSTRFMNIEPAHRKLEIGWTWLHPDYWATMVNPECKLLLLTYAFEVLHTIRVQLKTDEHNIRSRKAIAKIGGTFEGILRNDWIRDNGTFRNSAYFSIIDSEWDTVKFNLQSKLSSNTKQ